MRKYRNLFVEGLEKRAMLAGNVAVSVIDGTLMISGNGLANGVAVQQLDNGKFFVSGFNLNGENTRINGELAGRVVSGVNDGIVVDLDAGADVFVMSNSAFRRNQLAQNLSGGTAGPIAVSPQAPNAATTHPVTTRVVGDLFIATDEGNDGVGFGARVGKNTGGNTLDGTVTVNTANGADRVIADRTEAFDDMLFDTGSGNDSVSANVARVGDFLFADLGAGRDVFRSTNARGFHSQILGGADNDGIRVANYRFTEEIFLFAGGGNNLITANRMSANAISITAGAGADTINVQGSSGLFTTYLVDSGAGNDSVTIHDTWVNNMLKVTLGDGNDDLHVGDTTTGDTYFDGGAGDDTYHNDGGNSFGSFEDAGFEHSI